MQNKINDSQTEVLETFETKITLFENTRTRPNLMECFHDRLNPSRNACEILWMLNAVVVRRVVLEPEPERISFGARLN
jgi:predicted DNA-binding protein YlxM (UPF0122 family)